MTSWWPTHLDGEPAECHALAVRLRALATEVDATARAVSGDVLAPFWIGSASDNAVVRVSAAAACGERLGRRMRQLAHGVGELGAALARAAEELTHARGRAVADGLSVTPDGFTAPADHPAAQAVSRVRADEVRAHQAMAGVLRAVTEGPVAQRLVSSVVEGVLHLPDPEGDLLAQSAWLAGLPGVADLLPDRAGTRLGAIGSRGLARALASESPHVVAMGAAVARAAPIATRVAKASGPVGNVLTVVTEGQAQWQADGDDPRLSTADRVGRTAVCATLGGSVAIGGAIVGGQIGGAVGSAIPVVGTAAGAVVGAAIGGFAASELGRSSVDAAVEGVDDVIDLAGSAASGAAEAVSDAADAAGDAAEEVADKVCFWD